MGKDHPHAVPDLVAELPEEILALDRSAAVRPIGAETSAGKLIAELRSHPDATVVVDASRYGRQGWQFLDRRRSALVY